MTQASLLKRSEVVALVGLGFTTIWRMEKRKEFPARKQLSVGRETGRKDEGLPSFINLVLLHSSALHLNS